MAWTTISSTEVDALSPLSDDLMGKIKDDLDYLKSAITDAGAAAQGVSTTTLTSSGNGSVGGTFAVIGTSQFTGNVTMLGTLSVGSFFTSEQYLWLFDM